MQFSAARAQFGDSAGSNFCHTATQKSKPPILRDTFKSRVCDASMEHMQLFERRQSQQLLESLVVNTRIGQSQYLQSIQMLSEQDRHDLVRYSRTSQIQPSHRKRHGQKFDAFVINS